MKVYVCVKQVPDPALTGRIDLGTKRLVRQGMELVLDPADEIGVEEGLRLAEQHGGTVTIVSMGPPRTVEAIRKALAMGAHRAILVTDPALAGSDSLGTAKALAAALRKEEYDIILCATESTDASSGVMPGQLAELLGIPQLTFAKKLVVSNGQATIHRQTEYGYQVIQAPLPVLVTVTSGINEPRYPSLKGIMTAKQKEVVELSVAALGLAADEVGEAGAKEKVLALAIPEARKAGEIATDEGEGGKQIADFFQKVKIL